MKSGHDDAWHTAFLEVIQEPDVAAPLKAASLAGDLKTWTTCLTAGVVRSCQSLGWAAAAKGHRLDVLPQAGQEYLGIDVMAFLPALSRWPFPVAAFELENSPTDDRVAYSLWKVISVRAELRVVFAFRKDWEASRRMVNAVYENVLGEKSIQERMAIPGETLVIIGNRGEGETFPWEYFRGWRLDKNAGKFEKL